MGEKIKTDVEQRLLDDLLASEKENDALRSCLESVSRYEKERHEFELKCAKNTVERDKKAVANTILNMYYGHAYVSFCEIFELKKSGRCVEGMRCTDCIDAWLREHFT